jgi:hypothetical protein
MGNHASELGPIAFDFDEGAAKLGLFGALRECFLEQTAEPVLLALNPEDVLNFLQSARARDVSGQKQTTGTGGSGGAATTPQTRWREHRRTDATPAARAALSRTFPIPGWLDEAGAAAAAAPIAIVARIHRAIGTVWIEDPAAAVASVGGSVVPR